jgi:hypothetical protein
MVHHVVEVLVGGTTELMRSSSWQKWCSLEDSDRKFERKLGARFWSDSVHYSDEFRFHLVAGLQNHLIGLRKYKTRPQAR